MKIYFRSILVILLLLFAQNASNGKLAIYHYTQEEGLSNSNINYITQGKSGEIWCSTYDGISKYDGFKWSNNLYNSLNNSHFNEIFFDEMNRLWAIYSYGGEVKFIDLNNPDKSLPTFLNKTKDITYQKFHLNNNKGKITAVFTDGKYNLWIFKKNKWKYFDLNQSIEFNNKTKLNITKIYSVLTVFEDVYVGSDKGLFKIKDSEIFSFNHLINHSINSIYAIARDKANNDSLWLFTDKNMGVFDGKSFHIKKVFKQNDIPSNDRKYFLIPNYYNNILYGTSRELKIFFDQHTNEIVLNLRTGLISDEINSVFLDRENILWIATNEGLNKIPNLKFTNFNQDEGLLENSVTSLLEMKKNKYVVGHPSGFTIFEEHKIPLKIKLNHKNPHIYRIVKNKKGEIYASAGEQGIIKINDDNSLSYISTNKLETDRVISIAIDSNQNIIYISSNSVYNYNNGKIIKIFQCDNSTFRDVFITKSNRIVLTTQTSGLFYQKDKNNFVQALPLDKIGISTYTIFENHGIAWIGTNNGIYGLSENHLIRSLRYRNYLINEKVYSILKTPKNELWIGTSNGIKYSGKSILKTFSSGSGIIYIDVNRAAFIYDQFNNLYVGTNKGVSKYTDIYSSSRDIKPLLNVTNLLVNDLNYPFSKDLDLSYDENNLSFIYSIPSYYFESRNFIYYKLIPLNQGFIEQKYTNSNTLTFSNLRPGNYKLFAKVKNSLGIYSDEFLVANITIKLPFYSSTWFILLIVLLVLAILYLIIRYMSYTAYRDTLEEEVKKRTEELEASKNRYMKMFYSNNAMMMILDPNTLAIYDANPSAIDYFKNIGYTYQIGDSLLKAGGPIDISKKELKAYLTKEKEAQISFSFNIDDDIEFRDFITYSTIIVQDNKELIYIIFSDITAQKEAEKEIRLLNETLETKVKDRTKEIEDTLEILQVEISSRMESEANLLKAKEDLELSLEREKELNKLKSQFILMISHEYRTPLTVIFSSAEIIKEFIKMGQAAASEKYLDRIQQSVEMLTTIMDNSLRIGEDIQINLNFEKFDLNDFIDEFNIKTHNSHKIILENNDKKLIINQDRNLIRQALNNIVDNAIKFSNQGSEITITNRIIDNYVYIDVQDFGIGMDDYTIERIFDLFYKSNDTIGLYSGIGLGMTLAKKFIDAINGEIIIKSELEKGTTVTIKIPVNL